MSPFLSSKKPPEPEAARASLELLYDVSRELTSALELRTVLQRVLFLSMKTVGASTGTLIVLDDNYLPVESAMISGDVVTNQSTQRLRMTIEKGLAGWVIRNRQAALIFDTSQDERWVHQQYDEDSKNTPKSAVSAPLMVRDQLVGVITLVHSQVHFFMQDHLALVKAIADQSGIAVLNARLYAESQHQAQLMKALAESATAITATLKLDDVLQRILAQISRALRVEAVSLGLIDHEKDELVFHAAIGWKTLPDDKARVRLGQGVAGWVASDGHGMIIPDVHIDACFDPETDRRTGLKTHSIACAPIRDADQVIGVLEAINPADGGFETDALLMLTGIGSMAGTAIRHAQLFERLQAAHKSYRDLFDDSIDPIFITDWRGNIVQVNRRAVTITDYSKETLRGMSIFQLHATDVDQLGARFEKLASNETYSYESLLRTRSKHDLPIEVHVNQVFLEGVSHIRWIFRDITERKNLDTLREDLIAMIYHDMRAPLANVVSSLDVLNTLLETSGDSGLISLLSIALRSTERIQRLINSLLDIKRLEAGQPLGNRVLMMPNDLLNDAAETVIPVAANKQQTITVSPALRQFPVFVDGEMVRRVLINLLENAVKYTYTAGKIEVGCECNEEWVKFWVQDNGPGIPASEHERVFDKFTRLPNKDSQKGLGLGLAYCKLAVQGHSGRIWVESQPGTGSRFQFTLPTAQPENGDEHV